MRKSRFVLQYPKHMQAMRQVARWPNLDYDDGEEIVATCIDHMLKKRTYLKVKPTMLRGFLRSRIRYERMDFLKAKLDEALRVSRLPEEEFDASSVPVVMQHEEVIILECPFCFKANLNEYGACAMCHTIVPSHYRTQRNTISMSEESLAVEFDFNTKVDVAKAIAQLTQYEQEVVKAIGLGNETLETFADLNNVNRQKLWRTWVNAKYKLQMLLDEYNPRGVAEKSKIAIIRTLQAVVNTQ